MDSKAVGQSKWGRSRFGGSSALLIFLSLSGGLMLSAALALVWWMFGAEADQQRRILAGVVFAVLMLPAASALCWVFMLDRDTLAGAVSDPDSSIEGKWYEKAVFGAFHDLIAICGLGALALGILRIDVDPVTMLVGVVVLAAVDTVVRYLVIRKVEG
ncbi:hypothetical protein [Glutamicibacter sp.]|uniref:hypothetical protein n=1 Tax=Glutamicibacter sp. TaxID=1931995 RepID=UPI003D6C6A90